MFELQIRITCIFKYGFCSNLTNWRDSPLIITTVIKEKKIGRVDKSSTQQQTWELQYSTWNIRKFCKKNVKLSL
jgi:hypothetical protein